jgi:hypothetical protein
MEEKRDYQRDLAEIRSLMEQSSRTASLTGLGGIIAGIIALSGAYTAYAVMHFNPTEIRYAYPYAIHHVLMLGTVVLLLSLLAAGIMALRKTTAADRAANRQLIRAMAPPLLSGGILLLICLHHGLSGLLLPLSLIFYGIALFAGSKHAYRDLSTLGLTLAGLGLLAAYHIPASLLLWSVGFGWLHILFGIFIHVKHER